MTRKQTAITGIALILLFLFPCPSPGSGRDILPDVSPDRNEIRKWTKPLPGTMKDALKKPSSPARQLILQGNQAYRQGELEAAVQLWETALGYRDENKKTIIDHRDYPALILKLLHTLRESGKHNRALGLFKTFQEEVEQMDNVNDKARFYSECGDLFLSMENKEQAFLLFKKGIKHARDSGSRALPAGLLNNMGNAHAVEGDYERAARLLEEGLSLCREETKPSRELTLLMPTLHINLARVSYMANNPDRAMEQIRTAMEHMKTLPDSRETAKLLLASGVMIQDLDNPPPEHLVRLGRLSLHALTRARQIGESEKNARILSTALGYLGQRCEKEHKYAKALSLTRQALFHAQKKELADILYLWQWQLGRIFRELAKPEASLEAYENAIFTLTPIRRALLRGQRQRKIFFDTRIRPVYVELVDLLLSNTDSLENAKRQKRLIQARDTMEKLKNYELEDFFRDECVTARQSGMVTLNLAYPGTAILYPFLLEKSLVLLLSLPTGMEKYDVPLSGGKEHLSLLVKRFRQRLQDPSGSRYLYYAKRLHSLLITPIEKPLARQKIETLLISPDSVFCMIPFGALHNGKQYVIERYGMGTLPGMTLIPPVHFSPGKSDVLLAGLARTTGDKNVLPFVFEELNEIKTITNGDIIRDREFTLENLTRAFQQTEYSVLHMATHGFFGGSPGRTYLQTYDSRLTMNRLNGLLRLGRFRKQPVELLTLSACQTALGDERAALGLGGIALKAGAKSAVATLWFIDDQAATKVMTEFYRQLYLGNASKAQALQHAQIKLIQSREYRHPAFWAPFLLIGNWM